MNIELTGDALQIIDRDAALGSLRVCQNTWGQHLPDVRHDAVRVPGFE